MARSHGFTVLGGIAAVSLVACATNDFSATSSAAGNAGAGGQGADEAEGIEPSLGGSFRPTSGTATGGSVGDGSGGQGRAGDGITGGAGGDSAGGGPNPTGGIGMGSGGTLPASAGAGGTAGIGGDEGVTLGGQSGSGGAGAGGQAGNSTGGVGGTSALGGAGSGGDVEVPTGGAGTGGEGVLVCGADERVCGDACIEQTACCEQADCPSGVCVDGACACADDARLCGAACIPVQDCCTSDDCPDSATCEEGTCRCPSGSHLCGEVCSSDTAVETCGQSCEPCVAPSGGTAACDGTQCTAHCDDGEQLCAGACIADTAACSGQCPEGTHNCSELCVDNDSVNGCGESCLPCPVPAHGAATCAGGQCGIDCSVEPNYKACGSECIPSTACCSDGDCESTEVCDGGQCVCDSDHRACGGVCIPTAACCVESDCDGEASCSSDNQCVCDSYYFGAGCNTYFRALGYAGSTHAEGEATAVSADGTVVVGWSRAAVGEAEAFRWDNGVNDGLGNLPDGYSSKATSVNQDGSVVVGDASVPDGGSSTFNIAFRWLEGQAMASLGVLNYGTYSYATAVSSDGTVVAGNGDRDTEPRGIRWVNGTPSSLQYEYDPFWPLDTNQDGSVLVGHWANRPALLSFSGSQGTPSQLDDSPGAAVAVSDDGQTVLGWLDSEDQAYLWTGGNAAQNIGSFTPYDLSGNGAVAVGSASDVAVLWDASHGVRILSDVLSAAGVVYQGWTFWRATGVSADGRTIVGTGRNGARTEGFIVRLP